MGPLHSRAAAERACCGVRVLGGGSTPRPLPASCVSPLPTAESSSPTSPNHVREGGRYTLTRRPDVCSAKPDYVIFILLTSVSSSVKWDFYQPPHKALRGSERPGVCKVQRPPKRQTRSFLSCSQFQAWLKPLSIPDPPEPGEGPLPARKSWAPAGVCPVLRGRLAIPCQRHPSSAEALDTARSSLRGSCDPQLQWGEHARQSPRLDASSHPGCPRSPPVNATTHHEPPKGGATHSRLGTASWSPRPCKDLEAMVHHVFPRC